MAGLRVDNDLINQLNEGKDPKKRRFLSQHLERYNAYDDLIGRAGDDTGVDPTLIKAIMMTETGMKPVKNSLGYEGYAQTNQDVIDTINRNNGTSFTLDDMYDPYESARYIGTYIKDLEKRHGATDLNEIIVGYNWGPSKIEQYRRTGKAPLQTQNYMNYVSSIVDYGKPKKSIGQVSINQHQPAGFGTTRQDATRVSTNPVLSINDLEQTQLKRWGIPSYQNFKLNQYYTQDKEQARLDRLAKGQTKVGNAITDIGTGMLTWGTEMRPPSQQELERNRYTSDKNFLQNWVGRIPSTANAASWGMTDLMTAGAMGKIGKTGRFATDFIPSNRASDVVTEFPWQLDKPKGNPITLKSLQVNNPKGLHKQVTKDGFINTETALNYIKNSEGQAKYELARKAFPEKLPKKMDYNEFKKVINDQLIPLEHKINPVGNSTYGLGRIGNTFTESVNQANTLTLSNKNKFGRGSSAHNNPDETLGHIHFLKDADNPNTITATQLQSDAFQGTNRTMPKTINKGQELKNITRMENMAEVQENLAKTAKQIDDDTYELFGGTRVSKSVLDDMGKSQREIATMKRAEVENFAQKQLLDKNHEERFIQEFIDYAAKQDGTNKVRIPTSETAAKVQGYTKSKNYLYNEGDKVIIKEGEGIINDDIIWGNNLDIKLSNGKTKLVPLDELAQLNPQIFKEDYIPEHQTILKKYRDNPKLLKKLGIDVNEVTDYKGNSWYEFDIPEAAKKGEWEIKALGLSPLAVPALKNNEYANGGKLSLTDYWNSIR